MTPPFIVVRTFTIMEGKLERFKQFLRELFKIIEANEPRLLALNAHKEWVMVRSGFAGADSGLAGHCSRRCY